MKIFRTPFHPLCGLYLQSAAKWLTFISPVFNTLGFMLLIFRIVDRWSEWQEEKLSNLQDYNIRLCLRICYLANIFGTLRIDYIFYKCSRTRNILQLRNCEIYTAIITAWGMGVNTYYTFKFGANIRSNAIYLLYIGYKCYLVVIINYLIKEIENEVEEQSAFRSLTDAEIEEFKKSAEGWSTMQAETIALQTLHNQVVAMHCERSLQIQTGDLNFDAACPLGAGAYGSVYKGQLRLNCGFKIPVAVKTTDPLKTDVLYFKALLSELKVLARLGKHEHVVEFLGASISEIKDRKLFIVMELCALGSMYYFLKTSAGLFESMVVDGKIKYASRSNNLLKAIDERETVTTEDLVRWSYEIAMGMEFSQLKKVIHGDLAARNILLTGNKTAKITDFGLARQLYSYSVYVKRKNSPLPWRHLALESITDMTFSSLSDVWSYAVTLWEIFTLIETPWVQHEFNIKFVEQLKQGMRLNLPRYAPTDMYELMLNCWKKEPAERPDFSRIIQFVKKIYGIVKGIPGTHSQALGTPHFPCRYETEV